MTSSNYAPGSLHSVAVEHGGVLSLQCKATHTQDINIRTIYHTLDFAFDNLATLNDIIVNNATGTFIGSLWKTRASYAFQDSFLEINIANVNCSDVGVYWCYQNDFPPNTISTSLYIRVYGNYLLHFDPH